jgi:hypothetical protein
LKNEILEINLNELFGILPVNTYLCCKARNLNFGQNKQEIIPKLETSAE